MTTKDFTNILSALYEHVKVASEEGTKKALAEAGLLRTWINQSEAFQVYGRTNVKKWVNAGLVDASREGKGQIRYSVEQLNNACSKGSYDKALSILLNSKSHATSKN
jgi:hypothetical protein